MLMGTDCWTGIFGALGGMVGSPVGGNTRSKNPENRAFPLVDQYPFGDSSSQPPLTLGAPDFPGRANQTLAPLGKIHISNPPAPCSFPFLQKKVAPVPENLGVWGLSGEIRRELTSSHQWR